MHITTLGSSGVAAAKVLRQPFSAAVILVRPFGETEHTVRPLLTPDEVRNLPQNTELLFLARQRPIAAGKLAYYADPELRG